MSELIIPPQGKRMRFTRIVNDLLAFNVDELNSIISVAKKMARSKQTLVNIAREAQQLMLELPAHRGRPHKTDKADRLLNDMGATRESIFGDAPNGKVVSGSPDNSEEAKQV